MSFAFKRFNFFQPQQVARHGFPPNASCVVPGGQLLWVGTDSGTVAVLNSRLSLAASFTAHGHRVLEVLWLERRQLLVTVGLEEPGCSSTAVKIWPAERLAAAAAAADAGGEGGGGGAGAAVSLPALKTVKVFGSHGGQQYPESPVTAAAAAEGGGGGGGGGAADGSTPLTVALGLASGHVVVLAGEVSGSTAAGGHGKARLLHSRRLSARPDSGDAWGVTGLELTGTSDLLSLFVVTESQTLCFHLQTNTKTVLDPQGCGAPRCCALRPPACQLLTVARAEGLYDYTVDTRAGCTVFEGPKQRLGTFGRYMVVVTRDDSASSAAPNLLSSAPGAGAGAGAGGAGGPSPGGSRGVAGAAGGSSCLQLADIRTKLLAGTFVLQGLQHVFCAWGAVHAVTAAGAIWSYREIDLASQLEALLRRSLHKLALDVARAAGGGAGGGGGAGADEATLANIHQRWGDHLYGKGEYDAAMTQYLETVGHLEPSYVIRRFLDAQRIHNLTAYLELMHERGLASADHTTLLLNCYTKLKDVAKLDAFLGRGLGGAAVPPGGPGAGPHPHPHAHTHTHSHTPGGATPGGAGAGAGRPRVGRRWAARGQAPADSHEASTSTAPLSPPPASAPPALGFDADTAVRVLRGAGYAEHALWVADASGQVDCVLDVLLDDLGDAEEAIAYLETLPRRRRSEALRKYGRALIGARAEEATRLIMDLCCGVPEPGAPSGPLPSSSPPEPYFLASVSDFAHLYTGQPEALMLLCEYILHSTHAAGPPASAPGASPDSDALARERARGHERLLFHTLLELYLADALWGQGASASPSGGGAPTPPAPPPGSSAALDAEARRSKALDLLARGWPPHALPSAPSAAAPLPSPTGAPGPPAGSAGSGSGSGPGPGGSYVGVSYDPDHALVLCRMHGFRQGLLFLYDRLRLPREALQVYMSAADYEGLISAVLKYGDAARGGDPVLWAQVLEYFVQQHDRDPPASDCSAQISRVVDHVERSGVLPPLVVLQALARSRRLPLGLVRGYVARALQRDTGAVGRDREAVTKLASETAALREEVTRLRTQPRVFQASRCSASGAPLELPVVHFLCGHSFNARQLGEQDRECPLCGPSQRHVLDIRRSMQASSLQPERFFAELREAEDGFAVVAEALGRGAMNVTPAAAAAAAAAAVGAGPATLGP